MKNFINYETFTSDTDTYLYKITNYNSLDLSEIKEYFDSLDEKWFTYLKISLGNKIEKVLRDYYGSEDYYDIILLLNNRNMLFDMPYGYDVMVNATEADIKEYEYRVFGNVVTELSPSSREKLKNKIDSEYSENNNKYLYLKVINKNNIFKVKKDIKDIIDTQKEMYSIVD